MNRVNGVLLYLFAKAIISSEKKEKKSPFRSQKSQTQIQLIRRIQSMEEYQLITNARKLVKAQQLISKMNTSTCT